MDGEITERGGTTRVNINIDSFFSVPTHMGRYFVFLYMYTDNRAVFLFTDQELLRDLQIH